MTTLRTFSMTAVLVASLAACAQSQSPMANEADHRVHHPAGSAATPAAMAERVATMGAAQAQQAATPAATPAAAPAAPVAAPKQDCARPIARHDHGAERGTPSARARAATCPPEGASSGAAPRSIKPTHDHGKTHKTM